jgi:hypothetical protein
LGLIGDFVRRQLLLGDVVLAIMVGLIVGGLLLEVAARLSEAHVARRCRMFRRFTVQIIGVLALEQAYEFVRGRISDQSDIATMNGYRILDIEWQHGLFIESRVERFFLQFHPIMNAVDIYYVVAHVGGTLGALGVLYAFRREEYSWMRNMLVATTAMALISFYLFPTAPPRMFSIYGFVDPLQLHHLINAGGEQPDSYTYNPYAAMPSLHVGYALIASWACYKAVERIYLKAACALYPAAMAAVVVISGNHWIMDIVGAIAVVLLSAVVLKLASYAYTRLDPRTQIQGSLPTGNAA